MNKIGVAGAIIVIITTIMGIGSAAPLDISIEEKFNVTADYDGSGFAYATNVTGYINVTNRGVDDLHDIWVVVDLNNVDTSVGTNGLYLFFENASSDVYIYTSPSVIPKQVRDNLNTTGASHYIHIPLLKPNQLVSLYYDVDDSSLGIASSSPFLIDESYNVSKIPANRDVAWKVYFNVTLNTTFFSNFQLTPDVQMKIIKYLSNDPNHFGSTNWTSLGPISDNSTNKGSSELWNGGWGSDPDAINVTGIQLTQSDGSVNVSFTVHGNNSGSGEHSYFLDPFGFAALVFSFDGNVSGTSVLDVFAAGSASISVNKSGPFQNASGEWVVWRGSATITNKASGLTYVLTNVTMWATSTENFNNIIYGPVEYAPAQQLTNGQSYTTNTIQFEYSSIPIVWANATFELIKDTSQGWWASDTSMNDYHVTYGSNFIVIEKIYVIGSYLVKVTKHVLTNESAGNNVFDVYLVVENLGGQDSPFIYVYDMIPENFNEYNWNNDWADVNQDGNWVNKPEMVTGNGSTSNPMTGYHTGYWWRLNPLEAGADGDGAYDDLGEISSNQSVVVFYQMQGSGEFKVLDAFIVGLDPMLSMNEQTSPRITIVSGSAASSYETLMAAISALAGVIAIVGFARRD